MSLAGETWDRASSTEATRTARRFESAWKAAGPDGPRPDPTDFLPDDPETMAGSRLALLRAELTLRWEEGDRSPVEEDLGRFPKLDDETRVALVYEEFCLREEDGEGPTPEDYLARFPDLAPRLVRLLGIHNLVGSAPSMSLGGGLAPTATRFPEAGQTIAGFHLVEEIGRGAFARVFKAQERTLADRPVALKVSRAGSREPGALGRLQHTHIVPVHSYQTDPETGLHLLCMPYFGRVTLGRVLADPVVRLAKEGSEIVGALDRLDPAGGLLAERPEGRIALAKRPYARAVAWWGARLAEALQHAHDRGVSHGDVKPSNVLITGDGLPMLLDFNLAREPYLHEGEASTAALGGTLAYMAPEALEAMAEGNEAGLDGRADLYSLGVLLHEAVGTRPFAPPAGAFSMTDPLRRAAEARGAGPPRLRPTYPDVPAELEAVLRKCLAPEPADRYARASDLAEDLRAVADEAPLRHARAPIAARWAGLVRRHRRRLAVAGPVVLAILVGTSWLDDQRRAAADRRESIEATIREGRSALDDGRLDLAAAHFAAAERAAGQDARLAEPQGRAHRLLVQTSERERATAKVRRLDDGADRLRFALLDAESAPDAALVALREALSACVPTSSPATTGRPWASGTSSNRPSAITSSIPPTASSSSAPSPSTAPRPPTRAGPRPASTSPADPPARGRDRPLGGPPRPARSPSGGPGAATGPSSRRGGSGRERASAGP